MMQKKRTSIKLKGAGWEGEITRDWDGSWSWDVSIDFGNCGVMQACVGFGSPEAAQRSMRAFVALQNEQFHGVGVVPYVNM